MSSVAAGKYPMKYLKFSHFVVKGKKWTEASVFPDDLIMPSITAMTQIHFKKSINCKCIEMRTCLIGSVWIQWNEKSIRNRGKVRGIAGLLKHDIYWDYALKDKGT